MLTDTRLPGPLIVGRERHDEGVRRLLRSFEAIGPGEPVRLAKRTSNLFRPRA